MTDTTVDITLEAFEAEARAFLDANASPKRELRHQWGEGDDTIALLEEKTPEEEATEVREAKAWKAEVFDAGFGWITGPAEYGGRGLPGAFQRAWHALEAGYDTPDVSCFGIGLGMVAPTILAHARDEIRARYLPQMYRGDIIGAQLFSEPVAGSDLAGIQTRAERDGDEWVVTGQKVWTSGAQYSDIGEVITRTSPDKPKHKGLTMFVVDMHAPGVEVRPLRQMTGGASFNEVFFDEVRIADDHRLGDVDEGWTVALTTLMNERAAIGGGMAAPGGSSGGTLARLFELARRTGRSDDAVVRQQLAAVWLHTQIARFTNLRSMAKVKAGGLPGPEMSMGKLALTNNLQRISRAAEAVLGPRVVADAGEWGTYAWAKFILGVPGMRVAGGTDEVLRNIVSERVLGMPKEPRLDSGPFSDTLKAGDRT
jgi:acyl-CoA dehydrogenase